MNNMLKKPENIKSLFWISDLHPERAPEFVPHLYLESKIDFSDVRTGFSETYNISRAVDIPSYKAEPLWDDDAVREINPEKLGPAVPEEARFGDLPGHVDKQFISWMETQFIQYLLRAFTVKVYRNYSLDIYSVSGESRNDFIIRCADLHKGWIYGEFDSVHKVISRQLERLHQKYLGIEDSEEFEKFKMDSYYKDLFHRISERIYGLFLRTEFSTQHVEKPSGPVCRVHELEERLRDLHQQACEAVTRILDLYEEKIKSVDEYILHPTLRNIHFVSSSILWMPVGAV